MTKDNALDKERKKLKRIFSMVVITGVLFLGVTLYFTFSQHGDNYFTHNIRRMLKIAMGIYTVIVIFSSKWTFQKRVAALPNTLDMYGKVVLFRKIYLLHLISIEGALFFTYVAMMISNDLVILLFALLLFLIIALHYPSKKYLQKTLMN